MGVKLGLTLREKHRLRMMWQQGSGENYIMRSFMSDNIK